MPVVRTMEHLLDLLGSLGRAFASGRSARRPAVVAMHSRPHPNARMTCVFDGEPFLSVARPSLVDCDLSRAV